MRFRGEALRSRPSASAAKRNVVTFSTLLVAGAAGALAACHRDEPPPATPHLAVGTAALTSVETKRDPGSANVTRSVAVSDEIMRACRPAVTDAAPATRPALVQTDLGHEDLEVLNQIADCLTSGPLKGRVVVLTGRTGAAENNVTLGANRAHTVGQFLSSMGVDTMHMQETSSREQPDRRVDISLK